MNARHGRLSATLPGALVLLTLGACGGSGGDAGPSPAAAFESPDTAREITRAIVVALDRELADEPASVWMDGVAVSFDEPIDTDVLLRTIDAPLSVVSAMDAEGCLLVDEAEQLDRIERSLLEGEADERGETILLSTAAGSLGELTLEAGAHGENSLFDVRPGDLPRSARVAVVGGDVAFEDVPVPWLAPPSRFELIGYDVSTFDPDDDAAGPTLRPDSELRWETVDDDAQLTMVVASDVEFSSETDADGVSTLNVDVRGLAICLARETGRFVFPPNARAWMETRGIESDRESWSVMRAGWTVVRDGATALVITHGHQFGAETIDGMPD